jgi:hypothetical protein
MARPTNGHKIWGAPFVEMADIDINAGFGVQNVNFFEAGTAWPPEIDEI